MNADTLPYPYTLVSWIQEGGGFLALVFLIIFFLKIFLKKQLPGGLNALPLLFGFAYISYGWVRILGSPGFGSLEKDLQKTFEVMVVASSYTIILILLDCMKSLIKRDRKKKNSEPVE